MAFFALAAMTLMIGGCELQTPPTSNADSAIRIYRDAYGTPHIYANSNYAVFYGYGYAVAEDRLFQIEMLRRTTSGTTAEVLGADYLALDQRIRTHYDLPGLVHQVDALAPADRELLQGYADGFNARVRMVLDNPGALLPQEFNQFDFVPAADWTAVDVARLFAGSIAHRYSDFNSEQDNLALLHHFEARTNPTTAWQMFNASKWPLDATSPTTVIDHHPAAPSPNPPPPAYLEQLSDLGEDSRIVLDGRGAFRGYSDQPGLRAELKAQFAARGMQAHPEFAPASNYWALSGLTDADGALLNGPQFGFSVPSYVYGIGLHGGDFDATGNTLLALPALLFAHNSDLAWGSTAGLSDQVDVYREQLDPTNPEHYRHNNEWKAFESWEEHIRVRDQDSVSVKARRSIHGMVTAWHPEKSYALSRARAWDGKEVSTLMAWIRLATDRSLDAADQRIAGIATNINLYTMDAQGRLGYRHAGHYPDRAEGHDPRIPAPGTGAWDWRGVLPYSANPGVRAPDTTRVVNWNNRPAAGWPSSDLWTTTWGRADRVLVLNTLLDAEPIHSVASLKAVNETASYADVYARFMLPLLDQAFASAAPAPPLDSALALLRNWDQQWRVDETGYYGAEALLITTWLRTLLEQTLKDEFGDAYFHLVSDIGTPDGPIGAAANTGPGIRILVRNIDQQLSGTRRPDDFDFLNGIEPNTVLRESFAAAVQSLINQYGPNSMRWKLKAAPMQWSPYNFRGVPGTLMSRTQTLPGYLNRGSENNVFIARGGVIEGFDVIAPGQSGHVTATGNASAHTSDQMDLYQRFEYKVLPFSEEAAENSAVSTELIYIH